MKKTLLLALSFTLLAFGNAQAASSPLNEYNWGMPNNGAAPQQGKPKTDEFGRALNGKAANNACTASCPGYSSTITECPDGFEMVTCGKPSCFEYHKCEQSPCAPGYDTSYKDCPIIVQPDNYLCSKCK